MRWHKRLWVYCERTHTSSDIRATSLSHSEMTYSSYPRLSPTRTFCRFIVAVEHLDQDQVSKRYRNYGELRFSRLNYLFKAVLWRWMFPRHLQRLPGLL